MNANEYKQICNRPDAFQRGVLENTERALSLLHPPLASKLRKVIANQPIPKPLLHQGNDWADYFLVELSTKDAEEIADVLFNAEAEAVSYDGETTPEASQYANLHDIWVDYIEFRETPESSHYAE